MIPDLVIHGKRYTADEFEAETADLPPMEVQTYLVTHVDHSKPRDPCEARNKFWDSLVASGNNPEYARRVADRTAITSDRNDGHRRRR